MNKNYIFLTLVVIVIIAFAYVVVKRTQKPVDLLSTEGAIQLQNETPTPALVEQNTTAGVETQLTGNEKKYMNDADVKTLDIQVTKEGTGTVVSKKGDHLTMNYTGKLLNGTSFDSNIDPKFQHVAPFDFIIGAGMVIQGWEQGLLGMKVGEKRTLTIPAGMAYGAQSPSPAIPANSALVFDVELLKITPPVK